MKLDGEESDRTHNAASNYASSLAELKRFKEARALLCKMMPVARRVLGENNELTLRMRWVYAKALYEDPSATLDDLREAATTLQDTDWTARRALGAAHPFTLRVETSLRNARVVRAARDGDVGSIREALRKAEA